MKQNTTDDISHTATPICIENDGYVTPADKTPSSVGVAPTALSVKPFTIVKRTVLWKDPETVELTCYAPEVAEASKAGHFVTVKAYAPSERLPIPISDCDPVKKTITFICSSITHATSKIVSFAEGQSLSSIIGPLGHAADITAKMGHVAVVAEGAGLGPVQLYARSIHQLPGNSVSAFIGAPSKDQLVGENKLAETVDALSVVVADEIPPEKKEKGLVGVFEDFLQETLKTPQKYVPVDLVYVMGPYPLLRRISELTRDYGIRTIGLLSTVTVDGSMLLGTFRVELYNELPYLTSIYDKYALRKEHVPSHIPCINLDEFVRSNINPSFSKGKISTSYVFVDGPEVDAHRISWEKFRLGTSIYSSTTSSAGNAHKKGPSVRSVKPAPTQTPMPMQHPKVRCHNWAEISLGYTPEMALMEASRCLQCKKPMCVRGCPVQVPIPQFIKKITERDFLGAYKIIKTAHNCPSVTGRVCPQENQCQSAEGNYGCILCRTGKEPVGIGKLERFVADYVRENNLEDESLKDGKNMPEIVLSGYKVAIIGSGPTGLAAARECALAGHYVTIFEALDQPGGVLNYGIPKFRLPKQIVAHEINSVKRLGLVDIKTKTVVGKDVTIPQLQSEGYTAIFIGTGVGIPRSLGIPGEDLPGVFTANEFLKRCNLEDNCVFPFISRADSNEPRKKVVVIGCGNVAMDCASSARRLGADVVVVYRRRLQDSPARFEEIESAEAEGVYFATLNSPLEIIPNDSRTGIKGLRCQVNSFEAGAIVPLDGEFSFFACSMIIVAVGFGPNNIIVKTTENLKINDKGLVITNENFETSVPGVFCAGDVQTGAATVIKALGNGKVAGQSMNFWIAQNHATLPRDNDLFGKVISPGICPPAEKVDRPPQDALSVSSSATSLLLNSDIEETLTTHI
ncbi:Glutamate synthase [nadph] small chain [Giardia duodenalis]|uniref:Glutamate synthase [nadph] small chain n=1 Tax=Giardia intestinalis TaxID=5741 RepID=V6TI30_GIAIN|nr:Glutamate synthase [nadph] small chain [Giardia intestinalis]